MKNFSITEIYKTDFDWHSRIDKKLISKDRVRIHIYGFWARILKKIFRLK